MMNLDEEDPLGNQAAIDEASPGILDALMGKEPVIQMDGLDLSPGGADSPEGMLKAAFDKAGVKPEEDKTPAPTETQRHDQPPASPAAVTKANDWGEIASKLSAPAPASGAPDWAQLQADLQAAQRRKGLHDAISSHLEAVAPGFHAGPGADEVAIAKAPLEVAQAKQGFEGKQAQLDAGKASQASALAMKDPNSPQSQKARASLQSFFGSTGLLPPNFDSYSAEDVSKFASTLTPLAKQQADERMAQGREKAAADARAATEKDKADAAAKVAAEESASLEQERALLASDPRAKKLGITPEMVAKLDRKGIAGIQRQMESMPKEKAAPPPAAKVGDYSSVPENLRETVRAIVEGRAKAPDPGSRFGAQILNYVTQVDPKFDSTRFGAYKGVVEHQATSADIVAAETAQKHIQQARANIPANFDAQMLNRLRRAVLTGTGSAEMTPFEVDVKVAADEYAKALGNSAQSGREEVEHLLSAVQSPAQLASALDEVNHLLATKQQTWKDQLAKVAPKAAQATPSGKPYAKKQVSPSTGRVRYLDANGNVIEETGG